MSLNVVPPRPVSESNDSYTSATESFISAPSDDDTAAEEDLNAEDLTTTQTITSSTPWPGSCYIIRASSSSNIITLQDGQITLSPPGGRGSVYWECVERNGWLGFRAPASGLFLGHDMSGRLCCGAKKHQLWENFCARARPEGGYVLLMAHWDKLWPLWFKDVDGVRILQKVQGHAAEGLVWDFVKVR